MNDLNAQVGKERQGCKNITECWTEALSKHLWEKVTKSNTFGVGSLKLSQTTTITDQQASQSITNVQVIPSECMNSDHNQNWEKLDSRGMDALQGHTCYRSCSHMWNNTCYIKKETPWWNERVKQQCPMW